MPKQRPVHEMESKWQDAWEQEGIYRAREQVGGDRLSKFYGLIEFPYPSGDGLHVGHTRSHVAIDVLTRKQRMQGLNVLYPIGWDAFGLPTENFAIKKKVKPQDVTKTNIANFIRQIRSIGLGFDWSREINTTDPSYYRWTQWQFLQFYNAWYDEVQDCARPISELLLPLALKDEEAVRAYVDERRLAFKAKTVINWCPKDKIGLANEEVIDGACERCGTPVEKREKAQWMIRITKYADRLIHDLDQVDYPEKVKTMQKNWIGRSHGAFVDFTVSMDGVSETIRVFTTRPDTLFGVTFLVLAPEHPFVTRITDHGSRNNRYRSRNTEHGTIDTEQTIQDEIEAYVERARKRTDEDRDRAEQEKTGVFTGMYVVNPASQEQIPIWVADYVMMDYGTGAIMAVPAHDERDFAFAKKYDLPIKMVVCPHYPEKTCPVLTEAFTEEGHNVASDFLDGLPTWKAKQDITSWLEEKGCGARAITYRLRDWVFSRQRYWGEPIPLVHCQVCGWVPVSETSLPVLLPDVKSYEPTDTGESPLASIRDWVETICPRCQGKAERETDTMPNWAGSSWYFLRYCDPQNDQALASRDALAYWMPVDLYNGGMEHTTLHLLYSRFWYKVLFDLGVIPASCGPEPYRVRRSQGLILAEGGEKMSKSKGNVINPDEIVEKYGADTFRIYQMFMGPYDQSVPWDMNGIEGVRRFLDKVWGLYLPPSKGEQEGVGASGALEVLYHQTVKKITEGIDTLQFNTCVSSLMILVNAYQDAEGVPEDQQRGFLQMLAPFAPHLAEELWRSVLRAPSSVHVSGWPAYDVAKLEAEMFELVVQVDGKVRARVTVSSQISESEAKQQALGLEVVQKWLEGKEPKNVIYIPRKLISIVTR